MIKFSTFAPITNDGLPLMRILNNELLEKTAGYRPEVEDYISKIDRKADRTYILVNAMTSGDFYGPNLNGDYFPDAQLIKHHKTFETHGHAYRHHQNKDPLASSGKVVFSAHNPDMHRVELIIELENSRAGDIIERISKGEFPAVSMGTRTPSDKCSVCGNRAKNTAAYCDHLKYQMRQIMPDGKRVYALNDDRLTFFDISFVRIPADRTASVITKIAHVHDEHEPTVVASAMIGEEWLKRAGIKEADLFKEVPGVIESMSPDPKGLIAMSSKRPDVKELDKIAEEFPLKDILSTLLGLRMPLTPPEFERVVLISMKKKHLCDKTISHSTKYMDLGEDPEIPIDVSMKGFNGSLAERVGHWVPEMSMTKPLIIRRVLIKRAELAEQEELEKDALGPELPTDLNDPLKNYKTKGPVMSTFSPAKNPILPLAGLGSLYWGWTKLFGNINTLQGMDKTLMQNPKLMPIFLGMLSLGTVVAGRTMFEKHAAASPWGFWPRVAVAVPASYLASGHVESKLQKGKQINEFEDVVRKHPFLTGMAGAVGAGWGKRNWKEIKQSIKKMASLDRVIYGLEPVQFDKFYNDVIGNS